MENEIENRILCSREKRIIKIKELLNDYNVVCIKVNSFGKDKNLPLFNYLLNYFEYYLDIELIFGDFLSKNKYSSFDGTYMLYTFKKEVVDLKERGVKVEEQNPLGRLIDIDVYQSEGFDITLHRTNKRKCFICDEVAFICARNKTHSFDDLYSYLKNTVYPEFEKTIFNLLNESFLMELEIDPKFGCVTKYSNGSHKDMDYALMKKAKDIVIKYLLEMFKVGFYTEDITDIFPIINKIGRACEKEMLEKCNNVNCYKGLIFCLGILCSALGHLFCTKDKNESFSNVFNYTSIIAKDVFKIIENFDSFGAKAYRDFGFGGIRKEVFSGFPTIQKALPKLVDYNEKTVFKTFVTIIENAEDSVLLKRAKSFEKYYQYKEMLTGIDKKSKEEIDKINKICIDNNISLGGCADLLVCTIFISKIQNIFWN